MPFSVHGDWAGREGGGVYMACAPVTYHIFHIDQFYLEQRWLLGQSVPPTVSRAVLRGELLLIILWRSRWLPWGGMVRWPHCSEA